MKLRVSCATGGRVALCLIGLAMIGVALQAAADRPAVLLRDTLLGPPVEVAGTDLAPEVKVRVTVDGRGRVTAVEVLSIKPESEYDEAFRQSTIEELMRWRYAPAIRNGEPVVETLDWIVQFKPLRDAQSVSSFAESSLVPWFVELNRDADARHARIMGLPLEKRKEILLSQARTAERFLIRERRQEFATGRFLVTTDAESADTARIVAGNLEATLNVLGRLLQPHIAEQPNELKTLVYVYSQKSAYSLLLSELTGSAQFGAVYFAPGLIAVHLEQPSSDFVLSALIHEASHAYADRALRRPGTEFPHWLEEGFAEYMGNSQIKKGQLLPGNVLKRQYVLSHRVGVVNQTTGAGWDLKRIKEAVRSGEGLSLQELVTADRDAFYGDRSPLYYGMSWLFVHFLRHGEPDWEQERFPSLMLYCTEGYPAREAIEAAYARDLDALEQPFLEYVRRF